MDDDDDDTFDQEDTIETEVEIVPPLPWLHHDTVAASFALASNISAAISQHFMNLSMLAMGQSGADYESQMRSQFAQDAADEIRKILGEGEGKDA